MAKPSATPLARAVGVGAPREAKAAPEPQPMAADDLERARQTILLCMDGKAGRGSHTRLAAARDVLSKGLLASLSDEDLEAELRRRIAGRKPA